MRTRATRLLALAAVLGLCAACTSQTENNRPAPPAIVPGAALTPAAGEPGAWTYLDPQADLASYNAFILDEPQVLHEAGSSYGRLTPAEIQAVAQMFVDETRQALAPDYRIVTTPAAGVVRLRYYLIGVSETVPYVSTATRIIPIGTAINLIKSGAGGSGTLTGSVTYGIVALDSRSGRTLAAAVRTMTPGAFDLSSTLGTMDTARAVARDAALKLRGRIDEIKGRQPVRGFARIPPG